MERVLLSTEQKQVSLKQLVIEDASAYFCAVNASREHLSQFGDETAIKYPDLQSVKNSILNPPNPDKLRFGIWNENTFVGSINLKPDDRGAEIGYWLDRRYTGQGYATIALKAIGFYANHQFGKAHAWVKKGNDKSTAVMRRAGFIHINSIDDKLIFELPDSAKQG